VNIVSPVAAVVAALADEGVVLAEVLEDVAAAVIDGVGPFADDAATPNNHAVSFN